MEGWTPATLSSVRVLCLHSPPFGSISFKWIFNCGLNILHKFAVMSLFHTPSCGKWLRLAALSSLLIASFALVN